MKYPKRLNIKRAILFPVIIYAAYLLMDTFMPISMVGFIVWLFYNWTGKKDFDVEPITVRGMTK